MAVSARPPSEAQQPPLDVTLMREIARLKREIEIEQQESNNEQEQLVQVKEDLRKALIQNTQAISNLNAKDKQPTVQKPPPPS